MSKRQLILPDGLFHSQYTKRQAEFCSSRGAIRHDPEDPCQAFRSRNWKVTLLLWDMRRLSSLVRVEESTERPTQEETGAWSVFENRTFRIQKRREYFTQHSLVDTLNDMNS